MILGERPIVPDVAGLPGPAEDKEIFNSTGGLSAYIALMRRCWAQDPQDRPTFSEIQARMKQLEEQHVEAMAAIPQSI